MPRKIEASIAYKKRVAAIEHPMLVALKNATPQQAAQYVEDNVTDLASAKQLLKAFAAALAYMIDRI